MHELRIMKSGNEDENRRLTRDENKFRQKSSSATPQIIQVKDAAALKSLQLVFKSLEDPLDPVGSATAASHVHGHIQADGTVQLFPSAAFLFPDTAQHELIGRLLGSSGHAHDRLDDEDPIVLILRGTT